MLLKGKEKDARSNSGVIWNGISFEKMVISTASAYVLAVLVGIYAKQAPLTPGARGPLPPTAGTLSREGWGIAFNHRDVCATRRQLETLLAPTPPRTGAGFD